MSQPTKKTFPRWFALLVLALLGPPLLAASAAPTGAAPTASTDAPVERATFYKDVLPIVQENCQTCHRPLGANMSGMIAPMSFMSYRETRPWAKSIARVVESRAMPPWHASEATHGVFKNERTLTDAEIQTVVRWARSGAPSGDPADAPEAAEFHQTGWNLGVPDLVIDFPEPFFVEDEVEDLYQYITTTLTDEQLPEDRWMKSIEFRPGSTAVHHIIGHASAPQEGDLDQVERRARGMIGGNAPGKEQDEFPEGFGILLRKGSKVTFAMHYHKEPGPGTGVWDSSQIGIKFHDGPVTNPVTITNISYGSFEIPPQHPRWRVGASRTFEEDTYLIALMPHGHLRTTAAKYTAFYPDGTQELLLDVPKYDFNWQTSYNYKQNKLIPAGTRIEMEMWYDNSAENSERGGFNADRSVRFGGPTTDEMDLAWITIAPVEATAPAATGGR